MSRLKVMKTTAAAALIAAVLGAGSVAMAQDAGAPAAEAPAAEAPAAEAPAEAAPAEAAAAASLEASAFALNTPVVGSDGKDVGTVSRISSSAEGAVTELQVTTASGAVVVPASAIAAAGEKVQLSVTADEAAKFPAAGGAAE
ncbi:MAG: PRC-barrel domain-containing protein [Hyphomicrobium sp.]|nr:DUF2171 domain-containing protein [Hyphomicrobium sp.]